MYLQTPSPPAASAKSASEVDTSGIYEHFDAGCLFWILRGKSGIGMGIFGVELFLKTGTYQICLYNDSWYVY